MKNLRLIILSCLSLLILYSPKVKSQNSGPNAPEALQFEPVDATDMVNLLTGDVSYVLPILSIPGPEGDFPIAINYHAGITMDQEASWIGLGWNLNVGSISRTVMGSPDDMNGGPTYTTVYDYLGEYTRNYTGCSIPIYGMWFGTDISWGSDWSFGGSVALPNGISFGNSFGSQGVNFNLGYGADYMGIQMGGYISVGTDGFETGTSIGTKVSSLKLSYNSEGELSAGIGLSFNGIALASTQVTFSSEGTNTTTNSVGFRTNNGVVTSSKFAYSQYKGWDLNLLLVYFGKASVKSYYFQKDVKKEFGVLYYKNSMANSTLPFHYGGVQTIDTISDVLIYPYNNIDFADNDEVEKNSQLMLPAYDNYIVNAQGLSGNISPRFYKPGLLYGNGRTVKSGIKSVDYSFDDGDYLWYKAIKEEVFYMNIIGDLPKLSNVTNNVYYYFNNVNESYLKIREGTFTGHTGDFIWGDTDFSGGQLESTSNYNAGKHRKVNGNFVEYFTNSEIISNKAGILKRGFLETESIKDGTYSNPRENQDLFDPNGIGAFSIVSADGKTYHYSLPVYQFESFISKDFPDQAYFDEISTGKYAYTWLLTAITGPDFFDRPDASGNYGTVGTEDYGFWLKFDYGKWTDGYIWQLPYVKRPNEAYSWGRKQIYYLNDIKTKTHTAYFIKSLRSDGLGKAQTLPSTTSIEKNGEWALNVDFKDCNGIDRIFVGPWSEKLSLTREINCNYNHLILKLDKIVLVKSNDLQLSTTNSTSLISGAPLDGNFIRYNESSLFHSFIRGFQGPFCRPPLIDTDFKIYYQNYVLDDKDNAGIYPESKALKIIDFRYDYSLAKKSPNSSSTVDNGKLTLVSIIDRHRSGISTTPPYSFKYYTLYEYNTDMADDWGFNNKNPENWSLKEITTPIGSKIKFEYESDAYIKETATNQAPYYVFNAEQTPTKVSYNSTTGQKLLVYFRIPPNINKSTFFTDVTAYKLSADMPVEYSNFCPFPPPPCKVTINEKPRDINPIGININPDGYFEVQFYCNDSYYMTNYINYDFSKANFTLKIFKPGEMKAGGLRAKKVTITDGLTDKQITEYGYNTPGTTVTSGVTTYSPYRGIFVPYIYEQFTPGVFYEYVSVKSKTPDGSLDNEALYKFEVPATTSDPNDLAYSSGNQIVVQNNQMRLSNDPFIPTDPGVYTTTGHARSSLIKNYTAAIGRLLNTKTMNSSGQVINEITFNYKPVSNTLPGSVQETFYYLKDYTQWGTEHHSSNALFQYVSTSKIEYPSILDNMVSLSDGLRTTTYYDNYDINTGRATTVRTVLPNGKEYKSVSIPAYSIASYSGGTSDNVSSIGMGSKVWNIYNTNMLSQDVASYNLYNTGTSSSPIWKVIGTGIQTWKSSWDNNGDEVAGSGTEDQTGVWRKHKSFAWKGSINTDGTFNSTYFNAGGRYSPESIAGYWSDFDGEGVNGWLKTSEMVTYNKYSLPLQSKDINSNYSSTKTDKDDAYIFSSAGNARYNEFVYSGAEEDVASGGYFGGNVKNAGGTVTIAYKHIGSRSLLVSSGSKGFSFLLTPRSRTYKVSVWARGTQADYSKVQIGYNGSTLIPSTSYQIFQAGDWFQVTGTVTLGTSTSEIYCKANGANIFFDDFRVQPVDAIMSGYVYDGRDNVIAILNNDNFASVFEYDDGDRLIKTYKETAKGFEKVSENTYKFSRNFAATGFSWSPSFLTTGTPQITFTPLDNSNYTYSWNFGDNTSNSTLKSPTHTFTVPVGSSPGYYNVTFTITDYFSNAASETQKVYWPYVRIEEPVSNSNFFPERESKIRFYGSIPGTYYIEELWNGYAIQSTYYTSSQYDAYHEPPIDWMTIPQEGGATNCAIRISIQGASTTVTGLSILPW